MQVHFNNRVIERTKFGKNLLVGGAVPVLLNHISKSAIKAVGGSIGANRIVGIMSPAPITNNTQIAGGDLLNSINFVKNTGRKLGLGIKIPKTPSNIKFLF